MHRHASWHRTQHIITHRLTTPHQLRCHDTRLTLTTPRHDSSPMEPPRVSHGAPRLQSKHLWPLGSPPRRPQRLHHHRPPTRTRQKVKTLRISSVRRQSAHHIYKISLNIAKMRCTHFANILIGTGPGERMHFLTYRQYFNKARHHHIDPPLNKISYTSLS